MTKNNNRNNDDGPDSRSDLLSQTASLVSPNCKNNTGHTKKHDKKNTLFKFTNNRNIVHKFMMQLFCSRRIAASWRSNWGAPWKPSDHHGNAILLRSNEGRAKKTFSFLISMLKRLNIGFLGYIFKLLSRFWKLMAHIHTCFDLPSLFSIKRTTNNFFQKSTGYIIW